MQVIDRNNIPMPALHITNNFLKELDNESDVFRYLGKKFLEFSYVKVKEIVSISPQITDTYWKGLVKYTERNVWVVLR